LGVSLGRLAAATNNQQPTTNNNSNNHHHRRKKKKHIRSELRSSAQDSHSPLHALQPSGSHWLLRVFQLGGTVGAVGKVKLKQKLYETYSSTIPPQNNLFQNLKLAIFFPKTQSF